VRVRHALSLTRFEVGLRHKTWRRSLVSYDLFVLQARQVGARFNRERRPAATEAQDYEFDALVQLHARACRLAFEIGALMRSGHAEGAHARWRTLHEVAVTVLFIRKHGSPVAERYLNHALVRAHAAALEYARHHDTVGAKPLTPDELDEIQEDRDGLVARFGAGFGRPYGWAAAVLPAPTFAAIEKSIDMDRWRPWFRLASEGQHAGPRALAFTLGLPPGGPTVLLSGPSDAGLEVPGQGACIALNQITAALLTSGLDAPAEASAWADARALGDAVAVAQLAYRAQAAFTRDSDRLGEHTRRTQAV
jgi:hypothetical protein